MLRLPFFPRTVLLCVLVLALISPAAEAAFTSTRVGTTATMTGNSAGPVGDILVFSTSAGLLVHYRFAAGDPGFNSPYDFDTTLAGDQTLPSDGTATVNVTGGSAPDSFRFSEFNEFLANADQINATFNLSTGLGRKQLLISNSTSAVPQPNVIIAADKVVMSGLIINKNGTEAFDTTIFAGSGNDTFNIQSVPGLVVGNEPITIYPGAGMNIVDIASLGANLDGFIADIDIKGAQNNTVLHIRDSSNPAGRTGTLTATSFTGPGLGTISWDADALMVLNLFFGHGANNITVTGSPADTNTGIISGLAADTYAITSAGVGQNGHLSILSGSGNDTFNVTAGAGGVDSLIHVNGDLPFVAPGDTLNYVGAAGIMRSTTITSPGNTPVLVTNIETLTGVQVEVVAVTTNAVAPEAGGPIQVFLQLSGRIPTAVSVDVTRTGGTATPGVDFSTAFPVTVNFNPDSTSASFLFTPTNDATAEGDETVTFALANPSSNAVIVAPSTGTITITNNAAASGIPTLSEWALIIVALSLAAVALMKIR